jgi:hypothetical protein
MAKKQKRFRMPGSVPISIDLIDRLNAAAVIASQTNIFRTEGFELLKVINEISALKPFPTNNYIQFWALFSSDEDRQFVVNWLYENKYINKEGKWVKVKYFSWVLDHLFEQGWIHSFPADKARQTMAEISFKTKIGPTTIKKIVIDSGEGIKPNPSKKRQTKPPRLIDQT